MNMCIRVRAGGEAAPQLSSVLPPRDGPGRAALRACYPATHYPHTPPSFPRRNLIPSPGVCFCAFVQMRGEAQIVSIESIMR